ncbi:hypothetical protein [Natranaeroarchaeum sulfidigenes]|uniref:Uncharacterized protein n=1 Tax=Natranaeroarchaeum sulfidigenes TaxID=2784880 RepID=A0A897MPF0_9EURY|nr:hypothetical protein [Natranaeroarchaeum sulfidigenes]QSG02464.1 hypothetical protein AArcS_1247 [Natranaeroarchaeum sulfidigenes]
MTIPPQPKQGLPSRPTEPPTLEGMVALLGLIIGVFAVMSYPVASAMAIVTVLGSVLGIRYHLANRSEADRRRTRTIHIPGIGAIEYRITA